MSASTNLYRQFPSFSRISFALARRTAVVQIQTQLLHFVGVAFLLVTLHTEIEILAERAVVPRLDVLLATVTSIDELVLSLVVQLVQQRHGAVLGTSQRRKLIMLLARQGKEGVPAIHEITIYKGVRILNRLEEGENRL